MVYEKQPTGEMGVNMRFKQAGIEKSQRSTQDSIRVSGSATDATLMAIAVIQRGGKVWNESEIKNEWEMWRKYFFEKRDINETFKDLTVPF